LDPSPKSLSPAATADVGLDLESAEEAVRLDALANDRVSSSSAEAFVVTTPGVRRDIHDCNSDVIAKPSVDLSESSSSSSDVAVSASVAEPNSTLEDPDDQEVERLLLNRSHALREPSATGSRVDIAASDKNGTVLVDGFAGRHGETSNIAEDVHSEVQEQTLDQSGPDVVSTVVGLGQESVAA
ncbi:hypothetical protein BGX31_005812, partial [Mortierella sp. GBA43]